MNKEKMSAIIYEIILAGIGIFGIISVPLTCILPEVSIILAAFLSMAVSVLWVCILHMQNKYNVLGIIIVLIGTFFYIWMNLNQIKSSIIRTVQAFVDEVRQKSGIILTIGDIGEESAGFFYLSFLLVLIIIIGLLVAIEVVMIQNMAGAIITILPVLILFITFSVIPAMISFLCCVFFVFGTAAFHKKSESQTAGYMVLVIGAVTCIFVAVCLPQNGFVRRDVFVTLYNKVAPVIDSVSGTMTGTDSQGGINFGELGKINEIKYNEKELANVTTIETGRNQYFKIFTGITYTTDQWIEDEENGEKITESIFNMMDASEQLQLYVANEIGSEYYENFKLFDYVLTEKLSGRRTSGKAFSVPDADYYTFKKIADRNVEFYLTDSDALEVLSYFVSDENSYRKVVEDKYGRLLLQEQKDLMNELMGEVSVGTYNEKVAYIERVKRFLEENYTYTISPGKVPEDRDFLEYFLMESKQGYCTYFATAATMMFRHAGIPARYCEGYVLTNDKVVGGTVSSMEVSRYSTAGRKEARTETAYTAKMTDRNAHAWVEVYMDGYGWIPVEVTPGVGGNDSMAEANMFGESSSDEQPSMPSEESTADLPSEDETTEAIPEELPSEETQEDALNVENDKGNRVKLAPGLIAAACVLAVMLMCWLIIQLRKRHIKKVRQSYLSDKAEENVGIQVVSLYEYFVMLLGLLGYRKPTGMDYEEYVHLIEENDEELKKCDIETVISLLLRANFSGIEELTDEEFRQITDALEKMKLLVYTRTDGVRKLKVKYIDAL